MIADWEYPKVVSSSGSPAEQHKERILWLLVKELYMTADFINAFCCSKKSFRERQK
jgi:hypothetical protein